MPVKDDVGYGACTAEKQADFRYLVGYHTEVVKRMYEKASAAGKVWPPPEYWYFDITAGSGRHPETGEPGSPLIFAEEALAHGTNAVMFLHEQNSGNCDALRSEFSRVPVQATIYHGDHHETLLPSIPTDPDRARLGLLYCDTNATYPPFDLLAEFAGQRLTKSIDVLIYASATTIKRCCGAFPEKGFLPLREALSAIPKAVWLVRKQSGRHQWTFLLGTNWVAQRSLAKRDFWRVDSPEGEAILRLLTEPRRHANGCQQPIPDLC